MYFFVEGIGQHIGGVFASLIVIAVIGVLSMIGWVCYGVYNLVTADEQVIETSHKITPTIKLHTDGHKIDTIYVYTYNK